MGFSPQQIDAINEPINNILVSAAAGSGKTTILVERIITKILNGEVTVDRLLVMTFTKAAAENMVVKINRAIKEKLKTESDPQKKKMLKEQLNLLPSAYIQTIDSFCSRVIREKGSEAVGFDKETGLLPVSESEKAILLRYAAKTAVSSTYNLYDDPRSFDDTAFFKLTSFFGDGRSDNDLVDSLVGTFSKLRSLPNYLDTVEKMVVMREEQDRNNKVLFLDRFILKMKDFYASAAESARQGLDDLVSAGLKQNYVDILEPALHAVLRENDIVSNLNGDPVQSFEEIANSIRRLKDVETSGLGFRNKDYKATIAPAFALLWYACPGIDGFKTLLADYNLPQELQDVFDIGLEGLIERQKKRTAIIREYKELLAKMNDAYTDLKKRSHVMDFSDMEHYALEIFSDPQVCEFYRDKFAEIYVDEYQDNSTLQDAIVEKFSNHNVFMVGDVKQSIYKFRYANPKLFNNRMEQYGKEIDGKLFKLNINFRSTPQILEFVNTVFYQLMSGEATEIEYNKDHKLTAFEETPDGEVPSVVLVDIRDGQNTEDDEEDTTDDYILSDECSSIDFSSLSKKYAGELKGVIREIKNYLSDPSHEPKDICILTRSNERARSISKALNLLGVPSSCFDEKKLYEDNDISSLCALLTILGNQHRDECMLGVMLAGFRFSNFTVNDIAKITIYAEKCDLLKMNLIDKLRCYADRKDPDDVELYERVLGFLEAIDGLRSEAMMFNISELIERIYAETGILANVKKNNTSEVRKLRQFKDWLVDSFIDRGSDISAIAATLDSLKIEMPGAAGFEIPSEDTNAVNVMTYHKSKGLEFPFVIVTQLDSDVKEDKSLLSFDESFGFIAHDLFEDETVRRCPSFESMMHDDEMHLECMAEALRLLYVAMTRAERKLSMVMSFKPVLSHTRFFEEGQREKSMKFSRKTHLSFKNVSEEFMLSLMRISKADVLKEEMGIPDCAFIKDISDFEGFDIEMINFESVDTDAILRSFDVEEIIPVHLNVDGFDNEGKPIFPEYKYEKSVNASSKTSVSEMKKEELKLSLDTVDDKERKRLPINLIVPKPEYYNPKNIYSSASAKGTLIHNLLHFFDFPSMLENMESGMSSSEALKSELDYLKDRGVVKDDMIPVVESFENELSSFLTSDLFRRITKAEIADKACFEQPIMFSIGVKDTEDDTLVQGVLDVMFMEGDEAVIVDYKTDRIGSDDYAEIRKILEGKHKLQLDLYAASVEASGIKVKEKIIWLVRKGREFVL